jgi:hypothetical protein
LLPKIPPVAGAPEESCSIDAPGDITTGTETFGFETFCAAAATAPAVPIPAVSINVFIANASGVATFGVDTVCAAAPWPAPAAAKAAVLAAVTNPFALDDPGKVAAAAWPLGAFAFTAASACAR